MTRRHIFISHHHADDEHVSSLTSLLRRGGYEIRNSSVRAKPVNQEKLLKGTANDHAVRRLLRIKMQWASIIVVLIGKETHSRTWVDWEIKEAHELRKPIVGVFARGASHADLPEALEHYGSAVVGWNTDRIIEAVEGSLAVSESAESDAEELSIDNRGLERDL